MLQPIEELSNRRLPARLISWTIFSEALETIVDRSWPRRRNEQPCFRTPKRPWKRPGARWRLWTGATRTPPWRHWRARLEKLELVVARDRNLALAPVGVQTVVYDLYASPDTIRAAVKQARGELSDDRVQHARHILENLASEADVQVANLPLVSYPAAIKAVTPLIDQGRIEEAKAALSAALNSLVVETLIIPLPQVRAQAMLREAQQLLSKPDRGQPDDHKARGLIAAARTEVQVAEALGYGTKADYRPLYSEIDDLQKAAERGRQPGSLRQGAGITEAVQVLQLSGHNPAAARYSAALLSASAAARSSKACRILHRRRTLSASGDRSAPCSPVARR